jgi:hypothetical protein
LQWRWRDAANAARANYRYRVEKVTDSTEFLPTQYLEVDDLCASSVFKVTIVPRRELAQPAAQMKNLQTIHPGL